MLGFLLGVACVLAWPRAKPGARVMVVPVSAVPQPAPPRPRLSTIEAVFDAWGNYAVWDDDETQVALWSTTFRNFSMFFEVRRIDGSFYFRSIPELTHPMLEHGRLPPTGCPLRFTESERQYREWREASSTGLSPATPAPAVGIPSSDVPSVPAPTVRHPSILPPKPPPLEIPKTLPANPS